MPADETFNGLSAKEWTVLSKNVWNDVSSPRQSHHLLHGATFPAALAERVLSLYSGRGDIVFDPFAGIGTTVIAAAKLDRRRRAESPVPPTLGLERPPR